jgi:ribose/xylose/arabinose/galactoside ABC-type transport system permease subunit
LATEPQPLKPLDTSPPSRNGGGAATTQRWIQWLNVAGTFLALILIFGYFSFRAPRSFPTTRNLETIARQTTIVAIAAMGITMIIIAGGIDLSVGSMIALSTVVIAMLLERGVNPWLAALLGIAAGGLAGLCNGLLVTGLKVVPFIVTLGTLLILRGAAEGLAGNQKIDVSPEHLGGLDDLLAALGPGERWKLVPWGVWIMFILVGFTSWLLRYTTFGRHVVAVGSNENTARLCGIHVNKVKALVYLLGGLFTGVAGLMQFSRLTVGDPTVAVGVELDVIAAAVIGGASLSGGEGSPLGSLIGAAIMTTIRTGSSHLGWENWQQKMITGVIIVLAVAVDRLRQRKAAASQG